MLRFAADPKRWIRVTAPVAACERFSPACLIRNAEMARWVTRAREALIDAGLIAYEAPLYQVLSLDTPPATTPLSISPPTHACFPDATRGYRSLPEVLRQTLRDPS